MRKPQKNSCSRATAFSCAAGPSPPRPTVCEPPPLPPRSAAANGDQQQQLRSTRVPLRGDPLRLFTSRTIRTSSEGGEMQVSSLPCSPTAPPLDDENLLPEILLRLPPQPSSLPRASLVCKRWRCVVSDPDFIRRFRLHNRRNPPLLGWFFKDWDRHVLCFLPGMEAPNSVPPRCFSLPFQNKRFKLLDSHHGLLLVFHESWSQVLVWDPVTNGKNQYIAVPAGFDNDTIHGTVLRAAGYKIPHFQVVLAVVDKKDKQHRRVLACIYSSEISVWADLVSMAIPSVELHPRPAYLLGNSLYWLLVGNVATVLEFDLERQNLTMIPHPVDWDLVGWPRISDLIVTRAEAVALVVSSNQISTPNSGKGRPKVMAFLHGCQEGLLNWTTYFP